MVDKPKEKKSIFVRYFDEFKEFAVKGNAIDLAIGVIIGAAFKDIVSSLVDNVIMPPISLLTGKVDFSSLFVTLSGGDYSSIQDAEEAGAIILKYGVLINAIINFIIIAVVLFIIVRWANKLMHRNDSKEKTAKKKTSKVCKYCMSEINKKASRCPNCTSQLK